MHVEKNVSEKSELRKDKDVDAFTVGQKGLKDAMEWSTLDPTFNRICYEF